MLYDEFVWSVWFFIFLRCDKHLKLTVSEFCQQSNTTTTLGTAAAGNWLWSCCVSSGLFNNSLPSCQAIKSLNALLASATAWSTLLRWDVYSGRCLVCLGLPLNSPVHSALQS